MESAKRQGLLGSQLGLQRFLDGHAGFTPRKTKMTTGSTSIWRCISMYLLLKMVIFQCHVSFPGGRGDRYCDTLLNRFWQILTKHIYLQSIPTSQPINLKTPKNPQKPPPKTTPTLPPPTTTLRTLVGSGHKRHKTTPLPCSAKSAKATLLGRQGPKDWVSATCSTKARPTCTWFMELVGLT